MVCLANSNTHTHTVRALLNAENQQIGPGIRRGKAVVLLFLIVHQTYCCFNFKSRSELTACVIFIRWREISHLGL